MKNGGPRQADRLQGLNRRLHDLVAYDFDSGNNLILNALLKKFEEVKQRSPEAKVDLKDLMPFSKVRSRPIDETNARSEIKKAVRQKLSNMRIASDGRLRKTTFTISELIAYCEMLAINPETIFMEAASIAFLYPVQYCSENEIKRYLAKAKATGRVDRPVRVPFMGAPMIGVSTDIYFTASNKDSLDQILKGCTPLEVGNSNVAKHNVAGEKTSFYENIVQMQVVLTVNMVDPEHHRWSTETQIWSRNTNDGNDVNSYLLYATKCFLTVCQDRYKKERNYMEKLNFYDEKDLIGRYCSAGLANVLDNYPKQLKTKESKRFKDTYTPSSFCPQVKGHAISQDIR